MLSELPALPPSVAEPGRDGPNAGRSMRRLDPPGKPCVCALSLSTGPHRLAAQCLSFGSDSPKQGRRMHVLNPPGKPCVCAH